MGLITLAQAEDYLNITPGDAETDALITAYIAQMGAAFDRYTNRVLAQADYVHRFDGNGVHTLVARQFPVTSLTSVALDPTWEAPDLLPSTDTFVEPELQVLILNQHVWAQGIRNYKLAYTAGYAPSAVPADIQLAMMLGIETFYRMRGDGRIGIQSKTKIGENVTYGGFDNASGLPNYVTGILNGYTRTKLIADAVVAGG